MKGPTKGWWRALEACRDAGGGGQVFTSREVAREARIKPAIAAAYLSKLAAWGYLRRTAEPIQSTVIRRGGRRAWLRGFCLTDRGANRAAPKTPTCPKCGFSGAMDKFFE